MELEELRVRRRRRLDRRRADRRGVGSTVALVAGAAAMLAVFYMLGVRCAPETGGRHAPPAPAKRTMGDPAGRSAPGSPTAGRGYTASAPSTTDATPPVAAPPAAAVSLITLTPRELRAGAATLLAWDAAATPDPAALLDQFRRMRHDGVTRVSVRADRGTPFGLVTAVQEALRAAGITIAELTRAE